MRGIEGAVPFLHGSQGCATYMRRYIISHFREPMDIAASGFSEASTIFGGGENLRQGLRQRGARSIIRELIGIATTCLTETIGEEWACCTSFVRPGQAAIRLVHVSTPSYRGTHMDGFHAAVAPWWSNWPKADRPAPMESVNVFPGMVSPADLRYLKEVCADFGLPVTLFPDYSETLDGPAMEILSRRFPRAAPAWPPCAPRAAARASIEMGRTLRKSAPAPRSCRSASACRPNARPAYRSATKATSSSPRWKSSAATDSREARRASAARLVDAYVDGHKYLFGRRAVVYGEEDLVVGLTSFLAEIGVQPVLCASGGKSGAFARSIAEVTTHCASRPWSAKAWTS